MTQERLACVAAGGLLPILLAGCAGNAALHWQPPKPERRIEFCQAHTASRIRQPCDRRKQLDTWELQNFMRELERVGL